MLKHNGKIPLFRYEYLFSDNLSYSIFISVYNCIEYFYCLKNKMNVSLFTFLKGVQTFPHNIPWGTRIFNAIPEIEL